MDCTSLGSESWVRDLVVRWMGSGEWVNVNVAVPGKFIVMVRNEPPKRSSGRRVSMPMNAWALKQLRCELRDVTDRPRLARLSRLQIPCFCSKSLTCESCFDSGTRHERPQPCIHTVDDPGKGRRTSRWTGDSSNMCPTRRRLLCTSPIKMGRYEQATSPPIINLIARHMPRHHRNTSTIRTRTDNISSRFLMNTNNQSTEHHKVTPWS